MVTAQTAINRITTRIASRFNPDKIVLFGSHARGTAGPDSDVDLLVIMQFKGSKRKTQVNVRLAVHDIPVAKDIVVATPEEVERQRTTVGTLIRPAMKEGKILYDRTTR